MEQGGRLGMLVDDDQDEEDVFMHIDADDERLIKTAPSSVKTSSNGDVSRTSMTASQVFHVKDSYRLVYLAFTWFGLVGTLPWNFFITAENYWQFKLRDVNSSDALDPTRRNSMQTNFGSYFSIASIFPGLAGFVWCSVYGHRTSLHWRVVASLVIVLFQFVVTAAFSVVDTDSWQMDFFALTMVSVVLMNLANAVFQASSFGMAGVLPTKYMRAAMNGQAIGGVLASLASIVTTAVANDQRSGAYIFFSSAIVIAVICIGSYAALLRNRYYEFHCYRVVAMKTATINDDKSDVVVDTKPSFGLVFDKIKVYAVSVTLVFVGSLASFPTLSILVVSVDRTSGSLWTGKFFLPFACFLLYNCGDLCGRVVSNWIRIFPVNSRLLPIVCFVRLALVPVLLACNVQPRRHFDVMFDSDLAFIAVITFIALSNGYLATLCMTVAPTLVRPEHQEMAGVLMSFFMSIGICCGAVFAFVAIQFL